MDVSWLIVWGSLKLIHCQFTSQNPEVASRAKTKAQLRAYSFQSQKAQLLLISSER